MQMGKWEIDQLLLLIDDLAFPFLFEKVLVRHSSAMLLYDTGRTSHTSLTIAGRV